MPPPVPPPRLCEDNSTIKWYGAALNRSAEVTGPTVPVGGPASPHSLLWLHTMNPANVFESISTLISAVYVMQSHGFSGRRFELRWHYVQQHLFLRLRGHAAVLAQVVDPDQTAPENPTTYRVQRKRSGVKGRSLSAHGAYVVACRSSSSTSGATHGSNGRPQAWARVAAASRTPPRPRALPSSRSALLCLSLSLS